MGATTASASASRATPASTAPRSRRSPSKKTSCSSSIDQVGRGAARHSAVHYSERTEIGRERAHSQCQIGRRTAPTSIGGQVAGFLSCRNSEFLNCNQQSKK